MLVTALGDDGPDGDVARSRLAGQRMVAPHLVDLEVVSAWRRMAAAGDLEERRAALALADLEAIRLDRVPHGTLVSRCWELRQNVSIYDAAYVALAEALDAVLVTADRRLAGAPGIRCQIELLG